MITNWGKNLFLACEKAANFFIKHGIFYYILGYTWGITMTLIGLLASLVMIITGHKINKFHGIYYFESGKNWGGIDLGMMFIRDKTSWDKLSAHELGHTYQNAFLGPLFIFIVAIPSMIRYWYREIRYKRGNPCKTGYDDIWFESSATMIGTLKVDTDLNLLD